MTRSALEVPAPQHALSLVSHVGDDHPRDAPQSLAKVAAVDGTYGFSVGRRIPGRQVAAEILPVDAVILASHDSPEYSATWARCGTGGVLVVEAPASTELVALSDTADSAHKLLEVVAARCSEPMDDDVQAVLWLLGQNGPTRRPRTFSTPQWEEVNRNYPSSTAGSITALCDAGPPSGSARLLLWHGPPGTGKTSAVLALLHAWRRWCGADAIADPERMFLDASYLVEVLAQPTMRRPWRLIICEDADEYLRSDARQRSGPGLGRLLNASDGLLGRGSRNLVLLTTNDELGRLHPAVTRPGRCLSLIEFGLFSQSAASEWLGQPVSRPMSLAEMYEQQQDRQGVTAEPLPVGNYL
jgi:hypothetical protein